MSIIKKLEHQGILSVVDVSRIMSIMVGHDEDTIDIMVDVVEKLLTIKDLLDKQSEVNKSQRDPLEKLLNNDMKDTIYSLSLSVLKKIIVVNNRCQILYDFIDKNDVEIVKTFVFKFAQIDLDKYEVFAKRIKQA